MFDEVGNAFEQRVDLRGFNNQPVPATSVFVDGVRVNEPDFNGLNLYVLPREAVERIELSAGASAIFAKNRVGGGISVITKHGKDSRHTTGVTLWARSQ